MSSPLSLFERKQVFVYGFNPELPFKRIAMDASGDSYFNTFVLNAKAVHEFIKEEMPFTHNSRVLIMIPGGKL